MKVLSIIPARGGSKGIPMKNLKLLNGKQLLDYSVNASLKSKFISRTIVSSDHSKILKRATKLGAEIIKRPKQLATDSSQIEPVIEFCLNHLKIKEDFIPDVIILLQNTSPLRTSKHIDEALELFFKKKYDSLLSVYSSHKFIWNQSKGKILPINYNPENRPNRQDFTNEFIENGAIYVTKYNSFQKTNCRISGKIGSYLMPEEASLEVDSKYDLFLVEQLMKKKEKEK